MAKEIMHKRFVCTESDYGMMGHNKLWYVTVYDNGDTKTEYGRTGEPLKESVKSWGSSDRALKEAEKMIKKKEKGKPVKGQPGKRDSVYTEVEVAGIVQSDSAPSGRGKNPNNSSLKDKAVKQIADGDSVISQLVSRLVSANIHTITENTTMQYDDTTGLFSTPAGVVGQSSIDSARGVLADIRDLVTAGKFDDPKGAQLIDQYMRFVPQSVGRSRPSVRLICPNINAVDKQVNILDSLQGSLDMLNKPKNTKKDEPKAEEPKIWDVTLKLNEDPKLRKKIESLYNKTRQSRHACHALDVKRIFEFDHHGMSAAFETFGAKLDNIWELWHGTRVGNILSIMSKGMIVPPANASHCAGRMFGNGLYFSDQSTKSLNYAYGYWGGGSSDNNCFMFLNEVAMGNFKVPRGPTSQTPPKGFDSWFAKANKSGVMNNEMIVPRTSQARPRYLIEFSE